MNRKGTNTWLQIPWDGRKSYTYNTKDMRRVNADFKAMYLIRSSITVSETANGIKVARNRKCACYCSLMEIPLTRNVSEGISVKINTLHVMNDMK